MRSIDERLKSLMSRKTPAKKPKRGRLRKKKNDYDIDVSRLNELNETELVAVAHLIGYETASRQMLSEDIKFLILGEIDPPLDCMSGPKEMIFAYVKANETIMASQMPCDLHCPTCPHHQMMECFTVNRDLVD